MATNGAVVVLSGGSVGAVPARRLSERPDRRVLLHEANCAPSPWARPPGATIIDLNFLADPPDRSRLSDGIWLAQRLGRIAPVSDPVEVEPVHGPAAKGGAEIRGAGIRFDSVKKIPKRFSDGLSASHPSVAAARDGRAVRPGAAGERAPHVPVARAWQRWLRTPPGRGSRRQGGMMLFLRLGPVLRSFTALGAILLASCGSTGAVDGDLEQARRNFPPMIIGANTRPANGTPPFARACPANGRVEQRGGPTVEYLGSHPGIPNLCRMRIGNESVEGWYSIWLTIWPGKEHAGPAFERLIHGRSGDTEAFSVRVGPNFSFHDVLRNEGVEEIRLYGRIYRAIKLSHYREGREGNIYRSVTTGWKDLDSGMLIFATYQHIAGVPDLGQFLVPARIVTADEIGDGPQPLPADGRPAPRAAARGTKASSVVLVR